MNLSRIAMESQMFKFSKAVVAHGDTPLIFYMSTPVFLRYLVEEVEDGWPKNGWKQIDPIAGGWVQAMGDRYPENLVECVASSMMHYAFDWTSYSGTRQLVSVHEGLQGKPEGFSLELF